MIKILKFNDLFNLNNKLNNDNTTISREIKFWRTVYNYKPVILKKLLLEIGLY